MGTHLGSSNEQSHSKMGSSRAGVLRNEPLPGVSSEPVVCLEEECVRRQLKHACIKRDACSQQTAIDWAVSERCKQWIKAALPACWRREGPSMLLVVQRVLTSCAVGGVGTHVVRVQLSLVTRFRFLGSPYTFWELPQRASYNAAPNHLLTCSNRRGT